MIEKRKLIKEIKDLDTEIVRENIKIIHQNFSKNLSLQQIFIIGYLIENKDQKTYQKDLEQTLNLRRSTLNGILKTMEKNNIIKKIDAKNDGRSKEVFLTKDAKEKYKIISKLIKNQEDKLTNGITISELHTFFNVIDKIKNNINKEEQC